MTGSNVANSLLQRRQSFTPAGHKERYHNHAGTIGNYSPRGGSILSALVSARGSAVGVGRDRKRCRRVAENVCCVNDAETLWRNLGQHHGTKTIVNFFPSLCIVVRISSLIYRALFSPTRHRVPYRTLPVSSLTGESFFRVNDLTRPERNPGSILGNVHIPLLSPFSYLL